MQLPIPSITQTTQARVHRPFIQGFAQQALQCATQNRAYAGPNLSKWFRVQRKLGSRDRRIVSEIVYALIRFEHWFRATNVLTGPLSPESDLSAVFEWMQDPRDLGQFDVTTHLSLPEWMEPILSEIPKLASFANHHQLRAPIDLRCNATNTTRKQVARGLRSRNIMCHEIPDTDYGLRIEGTANIQGDAFYIQGKFEVQDAASQYFIERLRPHIQNNTTVLDYCAGAGGKSLALAALGAKVYAHEPRSHALEELNKRAKRANLRIRTELPKNNVDIVVVDAPCSGTGRLRREPTVRWKWDAHPPLDWVPIQQQILTEAAKYVKEGGIIAYATCSILPQENSHTLDGWTAERQTIYGHERNCDGFSWSIFTRSTQ